MPREAMTGMRPKRKKFKTEVLGSSIRKRDIDKVRAMQVMNIDDLQKSLCEMHKDVSKKTDERRKQRIERHNAQTNIIQPNFINVELVLVGKNRNKEHKFIVSMGGTKNC